MNAPAPITVALVDDQALVRSGFSMLINSQDDLKVIAEAGDGAEAVANPQVRAADVVLMDVRMPTMDGLTAAAELLAEGNQQQRIIMLTTFDIDDYVMRAIEIGASGFLLKDAPPEQFLDAIRTVYRGDAVIAPSATRRLLTQLQPQIHQSRSQAASANQEQLLDELTPREYEVFTLIARGLTNLEIAEELFLSEATVKTHIKHILAKLEARDRVQLVLIAYQQGVDLGPLP